jgi:hypothetical protein
MAPSFMFICTLAAAVPMAATIPSDWASRVNAGLMAFTADLPMEQGGGIGPGYYAAIGNGFIAKEMGPYIIPKTSNYATGHFMMSGVYTGYNYSTPSGRAMIPSLAHFTLQPSSASGSGAYDDIGSAIDYGYAVYYNRTAVDSPACSNTLIEQRAYAHRQFRDLFVFEIQALVANTSDPWNGCVLDVDWVYNISWTADDVNLTASVPTTGAIQWQGNTLLPEEAGLPLRQIAVVFDDVIAGTNASGKLVFQTPGQNVTLRAVFHSDLDTATPASTAQANWKTYSAISSADLLSSHIAAMDVRAQLTYKHLGFLHHNHILYLLAGRMVVSDRAARQRLLRRNGDGISV